MPWTITEVDRGEILITGPGRLELVIQDFDATKVERPEDLGAEVHGTLLQRTWSYQIEPNVWLELISTADTANLDRRELHILHLGQHCTWHVPDTFAEALHALGASIQRLQ